MAHKITYAVDAAFNFKIGGFATGAYNCKCTICKERFIGDKRSNQCLGCAIDALAKATICLTCDNNIKQGYMQDRGTRYCSLCGRKTKKDEKYNVHQQKSGKIKPCYNKQCPNYCAEDREGFNCFVYHPDRVEICPNYGA